MGLDALVTIIATLIIVGVIWWGVNAIIGVLPVPEPIKTVIHVLMIVVLVYIVVFYVLLPLIHIVPRPR